MVDMKDIKYIMITDMIINIALVVTSCVFFRFVQYLTQGEHLGLILVIGSLALSKLYMFLLKVATVAEL